VTSTLIKLTPKHAEEIRRVTGLSIATLHRINRDEYPGIVRQRGTGHGARYYLHVPSFNAYASRLSAAS
jgi:hypothetical protein